MPERQSFELVARFRCRVCGTVGESALEVHDEPGCRVTAPALPEGWEVSYGASGRGLYYKCPRDGAGCPRVMFDDSGRGMVLDYSYYDDLRQRLT